MTTPTPPTIQTNPLDPVPNAADMLLDQPGQVADDRVKKSIVSQIWMQWFTQMREKINVIGNYLATWAGINPVSGVTAGTYGDATHWPVVTFNQYGQATLATVQIASSGAGILVGTWAGRPGSPTNPTLYQVTDGPGSAAVWDGSTWNHSIINSPVTPPVPASFTQVNWGTSATNAVGPFTSIVPQTAAAYSLRILDIAAPATPYTIECGVLLPVANFSDLYLLWGAGFRESSSGKLDLGWYDGTGTTPLIRRAKFNSATSINSVYISSNFSPYTNYMKFRFGDTGVNRTLELWEDGVWNLLSSVARTDFLTADRVCIAVNITTASVYFNSIQWVHWK